MIAIQGSLDEEQRLPDRGQSPPQRGFIPMRKRPAFLGASGRHVQMPCRSKPACFAQDHRHLMQVRGSAPAAIGARALRLDELHGLSMPAHVSREPENGRRSRRSGSIAGQRFWTVTCPIGRGAGHSIVRWSSGHDLKRGGRLSENPPPGLAMDTPRGYKYACGCGRELSRVSGKLTQGVSATGKYPLRVRSILVCPKLRHLPPLGGGGPWR